MSGNLAIKENLLRVLPDEVGDGNAPRPPLRDAPLIEVVQLLGNIQIVAANVRFLPLRCLFQLLGVLRGLLARLEVEIWTETDRGQLFEALELEFFADMGEPGIDGYKIDSLLGVVGQAMLGTLMLVVGIELTEVSQGRPDLARRLRLLIDVSSLEDSW